MAAMLMLLAAAPARADPSHADMAGDPVARWQPEIARAAAAFGIPARWIEQVMHAESGGATMLDGRPITSRAGAMGLMQLMPATWAEMRGALGLGSDPYDPHDNILAGAAYLKAMYARFGYPGLFAAYNAGPARYAAARAGGATLPAETRAYLAKVTDGRAIAGVGPVRRRFPPSLFAVRPGAPAGASPFLPDVDRMPDRLFAVRVPR